jgi:hypothetical protein
LTFGILILGFGVVQADVTETDSTELVDTEASVTVGYRGVSSNDNPGRAREYDSLKSSGLFKIKLFTDSGPFHLDLDADYLNEDDYRASLHIDSKDLVRMDLRTDRFFHNLDHIPYEDRPDANSNGSTRADFKDWNAGDDYGLRLDTNEVKLRAKLPDYPAHINLAYWNYEKTGDKQMRFVDENCAGACHVQSATRKIDRVTEEVKASADAHVGYIDVVLETLFRTFRDREPIPNDYFDNHNIGRISGDYDHSEDPDSKLTETTLKLSTAPSGGLVGSTSFTIGKRENHSDLNSVSPVNAETDYFKNATDVTYTPGEKWTVNFRYRLMDMDADNSDILTTYGSTKSNPLEVREAMDITRAWYEASVNYRPSRHLTLKGELRREEIDRSNTGPEEPHSSYFADPIQINPNWLLPEEETITRAKLGFSSRLLDKSALKMSGWVAIQRDDDPAYGTSFEEGQELFFSTSYTPSPFWGFLANANLLLQKNDDYEQHDTKRDREKKQQNVSLSSWLNPREGLSFDLNYGYLRTAISQDLLFGTSDPYLFKDDSVDYRQTVHSVTLGMTLQALENLSCRLEGYYIRSRADYSADFDEGPFDYNFPGAGAYSGNATSNDLEEISELDLRQSGLRGRFNWQIDNNWSCGIEATYDKYDDKNSDYYDGSVQTAMVSFSRAW